MKKLTVRLGKRSYPVMIGAKLEKLGLFLKKQSFSGNILLAVDSNAGKFHLRKVMSGLKKAGFKTTFVFIPSGERHKNLDTVASIYRAAVKAGLDRKSAIVALGGGVAGDLAGFAAATYLRGVPLVQVPTTLLAMVDSSVGGKTGFDLREGKNLVGAFYQPKVVWIDVSTLKTLPERHIRNGLAEVIKYGIIKDSALFAYLEENVSRRDTAFFIKIIEHSCAIKAAVVEKDEGEEKGLREILNFGHTFGHAFETASRYGMLHGQAVASGMIAASKLAEKLGMLGQKESSRARELITASGAGRDMKGRFTAKAVISLMRRDKKARGGKHRLVLPERIGRVKIVAGVSEKIIKEVL